MQPFNREVMQTKIFRRSVSAIKWSVKIEFVTDIPERVWAQEADSVDIRRGGERKADKGRPKADSSCPPSLPKPTSGPERRLRHSCIVGEGELRACTEEADFSD